MGTRLFVGNLSYNTTEVTLRSYFAERWSVVDVAIITDRETGRSRGFGFVELEDADAARAALEALDGEEFEGRNLTVREAHARRPRERSSDAHAPPPSFDDGGGGDRRDRRRGRSSGRRDRDDERGGRRGSGRQGGGRRDDW